jgi:hypothetical protein
MPPSFPKETSDTIPFSHRSTMFPLPNHYLSLRTPQIRQSPESRVHRLVETAKKGKIKTTQISSHNIAGVA